MVICQKAIDLIKHYESLHDGDLTTIGLQPKKCPAGIWTVGYGHALTDDHKCFLKGDKDKAKAYAHEFAKLTQDQAETLLKADLMAFARRVDELVKVELNDEQFGALVSFAYNVGIHAFAKSTLLKLLNLKDWAGTAVNLRYCEVVQLANAAPTLIVNAGEGIDEYDASSPTAHQHMIESLTVTTNGQTDFTLAQTPKDDGDVALTVNGIYYDTGTDYTVSGTTLSWVATMANGGFDLATTDKVVAHYAYAG